MNGYSTQFPVIVEKYYNFKRKCTRKKVISKLAKVVKKLVPNSSKDLLQSHIIEATMLADFHLYLVLIRRTSMTSIIT